MKCKKCGYELEKNEKFCPSCGERVELKKVCPACGIELEENIKFCPACGKRIEEKNIRIETEKENTAKLNVSEAQIIGKNNQYYEKQFQNMRNGEKCKLNWASLFLGIFHAAYRGVWKEWLKKPGLPLIIGIATSIIGGIAQLFSGSFTIMAITTGIVGISSVISGIMQILYAFQFNKVYMKHVEEKVGKGDSRVDTSIGRAIAVIAVLAIATGVGQAVSEAGAMSSLFGDLDEINEFVENSNTEPVENYELYDVLLRDDADIEKFISENGLKDEFDIGAYSKDGIMLMLNDDGSIEGLVLEGSEYTLCGVKVGSKFDYEGSYDNFFEYGYSITYEDKDFGEIAFGIVSEDEEDGAPAIVLKCDSDDVIQTIYFLSNGAKDEVKNSETLEDTEEYIDEYIIADSDCRYLTREELSGLSADELRLARNEIYARHGRIFQSEDLNAYFNSLSWYDGYISADEFNDDILNEYEKANLIVIKECEENGNDHAAVGNTAEFKQIPGIYECSFDSNGGAEAEIQYESGIDLYHVVFSGSYGTYSGYTDGYLVEYTDGSDRIYGYVDSNNIDEGNYDIAMYLTFDGHGSLSVQSVNGETFGGMGFPGFAGEYIQTREFGMP